MVCCLTPHPSSDLAFLLSSEYKIDFVYKYTLPIKTRKIYDTQGVWY